MQRGKERCSTRIISESFADLGKAIDISRPEYETPSELKRILSKLVLMIACGASAVTALEIVGSKHVQQIRRAEVGDSISLALFVNQQRKSDARFFAKNPRVVSIAQADSSEGSSFISEGLLLFAQLRDVLAAKDSAIVAKKNDHGRFISPQRTQPDFLAIRIRKKDVCELLAKRFLHVQSSFTSRQPLSRLPRSFSFLAVSAFTRIQS
jgi:hypothetical protein